MEADVHIGRLGANVGEASVKVWVQWGLWDGLTKAIETSWQVIAMTLDTMGRLLMGHAGLDNLSGPLSMADYAGRSASLAMVDSCCIIFTRPAQGILLQLNGLMSCNAQAWQYLWQRWHSLFLTMWFS